MMSNVGQVNPRRVWYPAVISASAGAAGAAVPSVFAASAAPNGANAIGMPAAIAPDAPTTCIRKALCIPPYGWGACGWVVQRSDLEPRTLRGRWRSTECRPIERRVKQ